MLGKEGRLSFKEFLDKIELDESLLGEPEKCWTRRNGQGAFKVQVFRISNIKNEDERKSALFDFSKEVYSFSDEKNERKRKDLYKYIGISVFMIAVEALLFTAVLLTKRSNSLQDIRPLLEVGLYIPMTVLTLVGVFLLSNFWIASQTIDANNIQVLETRLGGHIDYVNLAKQHLQGQGNDNKSSLKSNRVGSYCYNNPQMVEDDGKPKKVLATSFMQNGDTDCANFPPPLESPEGKNGFAPSTIQLTSNGLHGRS